MNKVLCFEDLLVWQKAKEQVVSIYKIFRACKDYSFRDQIQRAAISVMNNIAEDFERKTNNEFKYFFKYIKRKQWRVKKHALCCSGFELY